MFKQLENCIRNLKLSGHVGFDSLPDQLVNKSVQNGFVFNILCIGEYILRQIILVQIYRQILYGSVHCLLFFL